jgi:hypothetical protein
MLIVINKQKSKGYKLNEAKVNFIFYWKKTDEDKEIQIILPEFLFERLI